MEVLRTPAIVLRRTAYRDSDQIIDLLGLTTGRFTVLARGARKSRRRFGGALELGNRIEVVARRRGTGMATLSECEIKVPIRRIRTDLNAINHLSYVLEIIRLCVREGVRDDRGYALVSGYLDALEEASPTHEALALWECALLKLLGFGLSWDRCVISGGMPNGLSLEAGGLVDRRRYPRATPLSEAAISALQRLQHGDSSVEFSSATIQEVRYAFAQVWRDVTGHTLRTAPFLLM